MSPHENRNRLDIIAIQKKNGHDLVQLKDYFDVRLLDLRELVTSHYGSLTRADTDSDEKNALRFQASERATDLAREAVEYRLEGLNNVYKTMKEAQLGYVSKPEHDASLHRINAMELQLASLQGRMLAVGVLNAVLTIGATIGAVFISHFVR
jgi:hypothetical protein